MRMQYASNITFNPRCLTTTDTCVDGAPFRGKAKPQSKHLSVPTKLCYSPHRHTHPRENSLHRAEKAESQRTLPPHSARRAAGLPGNCRFSHPSLSLVQASMELARKLQLPECSGVTSGCGVTTVAEKARGALRSGLALLGRWQVAGCWCRG